jgi:hypothetical protein
VGQGEVHAVAELNPSKPGNAKVERQGFVVQDRLLELQGAVAVHTLS